MSHAPKRHPLHSLCSYIGCFPPQVPRAVIQNWMPRGGAILDPFCGSGTTLVESRLLGRPCIGIDLNPLAVAISSAKIENVACEDVLYRLLDLGRCMDDTRDIQDVPDGLRTIFHPRTLRQLCYLRKALDPKRPEDIFIRAAVLGIMHGKFRRDQSTAYLSIDMPNTFSMSPEYVRQFVDKHKLRQPAVDVFAKLQDRVIWLLREGAAGQGVPAQVIHGDAARLPEILVKNGIEKIGGIVTSPPYLGVLRYGAFNWIRLWFLGYEPAPVDRLLDGTDSLDRYLSFMASFLRAAGEILTGGTPMALVIGDVVESGQHVPLAVRVWDELGGVVPFELIRIEMDQFDITTKTTRIWGEEKKGRATPVDRILILKKAPKRRSRGRTELRQAVG